MTEEPSADDASGTSDAEEGDDALDTGEEDDAPDAEKGEDAPDADDGDRATDDEQRESDAAEGGLAPARSEEDPDVDAAREELEAIGRAAEDGEDAEDEPGDAGTATEDSEAADEASAEPGGDESTEPAADEPPEREDEGSADDDADVDEAPDEDPNPEDLVRDPDEPQVTSSLGAAEAEEEVEEDIEGKVEAAAEETDAETPESGVETTETAADADQSEDTGAETESPGAADSPSGTGPADATDNGHQPGVPDDVQKYDRFKKVDGSQYDRVNEFLRDRTYITAREWAIARLCSDFRTETGVEMTKIGENLPELVPFMTDTYTPQAVNQARSSFEDKIRTAGATFLYGAMCDFFTAEELDDVMYEATEVAKFLLEVEGVELSVEDELDAEDRISAVMREVRSSSAELRHERCPECGAELSGGE